jgi:hypothetical protein
MSGWRGKGLRDRPVDEIRIAWNEEGIDDGSQEKL